ncbi:MAG TPA: hypothetical protein ENI51_06080 [Candidatus Atribacteria bacterium]|nr:hypothetical protein [Candidatus Atribacteria bacterium]
MQLEKTIEIDGKKITIKELRAKDIYQAKLWAEEIEILMKITVGDYETMMRFLPKCVEVPEGVKLEELMQNVNSYARLFQAFREVNKDFLSRLPAQIEELIRGAEVKIKA